MFKTVQSVVRTESLDQLQSLMNDSELQLTDEEYRQLVVEAVLFQKYQSLKILVNEAAYIPYSTEELEDGNFTTVLQVALNQLDIEAVKILSTGAFGQLTKQEIRAIVDGVVDSVCSGESYNLNQQKLNLLYLSPDEDIHKLIREYLTASKIVDQIPSISWLFDLLRYGPGLNDAICKKAFMEMEKGDWLEAEKTLFKISQSDNIDQPIRVYYPLEDTEESWTLLGYAISKNRTILVKLLLTKGASVDKMCYIDSRQGHDLFFMPLEVAVNKNLYEISSLILQKLSDRFHPLLQDMTALIRTAILHENTSLLQILMESSRSPGSIEEWYEELLKEVKNFEKRTIMNRFLRNFIRFGTPKLNKCQEALIAMFEGTEQEALDEIKSLDNQDVNQCISFKSPAEQMEENNMRRREWTLLLYAVKRNNMEIVKHLISRGVDVNQSCAIFAEHRGGEKVRALTIAVDEGNFNMCKFLLDNGACIKLERPERWPSFHEFEPCSVFPYAFRRQDMPIIQLLIERSDDPGDVFISFCFGINVSVESEILAKIFNLENMKTLLCGKTLTTLDWTRLVLICSCCENTSSALRRCRCLLVNVILGYYGFVPKELKEAVETLEERCQIAECIRNNILCPKVIIWFYEQTSRFPDLKRMCRFVIRQSCRPCTESSLLALGLPPELQCFVDHPLKDVFNSEPASDIQRLSLEDKDDIVYLEIK